MNTGCGEPTTIVDVARRLARVLGVEVEPEVTGRYRVGDVRHCTADISRARALLGYEPRIAFDQGLEELLEWIGSQEAPESRAGEHVAELAARGLAF